MPNDIFLWIGSLLLRITVQKKRSVKPKPSELLLGVSGTISCSKLVLSSIYSSTDYRPFIKTSSSPSSLRKLEMQPSVAKIKSIWFNQVSKPPSNMWIMPSGKAKGQTPNWTPMARLSASSKKSGEATRIATITEGSRKRFRSRSFEICLSS